MQNPNNYFKTLFLVLGESEKPLIIENQFTKVLSINDIDCSNLDLDYDLIYIDAPTYIRDKENTDIGRVNLQLVLNLLDKTINQQTIIAFLEFNFNNVSKDFLKFTDLLNSKNFYLNAIFEYPSGFYPMTSLSPQIVVVSKKNTETIYLEEVENEIEIDAINNLFMNKNDIHCNGWDIARSDFKSFMISKTNQKIKSLDTLYKGYKFSSIRDISQVFHGRKTDLLKLSNNSIAISIYGKNVYLLNELINSEYKIDRYIFIDFKPDFKAKYIKIFLDSELGRLMLKSTTFGLTVPIIIVNILKELSIPIPELVEQKSIIEANDLLIKLEEATRNFREILSNNPRKSRIISEKILPTLSKINALSITEELSYIIAQGENKKVEFKETAFLDVAKGNKQDYIKEEIIKTIAGFINTEGGHLFVGVNDNGEIVGLKNDINLFKNRDKYLLAIRDLVSINIRADFNEFINYELIDFNDKTILYFRILKSEQKPCFVKFAEEILFKRENPSTIRIGGQAMVDYIKVHFKS